MTHDEIAAAVADVIQEHVTLVLAPVLTRLAVAETQVAQFARQTHALGDLRDRVVVVETKAALPTPVHPEPADLAPVHERLAAAEARLLVLGDVRDRIVTMETKAAIPVVQAVAPEPVAPVDLAPVLERLAATEARLSVLGDLRDRVVTIETKAAVAPVIEHIVADPQTPVDLSPMLERLAVTEAGIATLADVRDRLAVVETKAAEPSPVPDLGDVRERLSALDFKLEFKGAEVAAIVSTLAEHTKDIGAIRERVAVAEIRPLQPGPAGKDGENGQRGMDGMSGKDGRDGLGWDDLAVAQVDERTFSVKCTRGLQTKDLGTLTFPVEIYRGVYIDGKSYDRGDCVTWAGSEWHANESTTTKPGDGSKAWTLKVKRGRDGKDGQNAQTVPVVSVKR